MMGYGDYGSMGSGFLGPVISIIILFVIIWAVSSMFKARWRGYRFKDRKT